MAFYTHTLSWMEQLLNYIIIYVLRKVSPKLKWTNSKAVPFVLFFLLVINISKNVLFVLFFLTSARMCFKPSIGIAYEQINGRI